MKEIHGLKNSLDRLQTELSTVRSENLKLFERMRFVQSFKTGVTQRTARAATDLEIGDETEAKYEKLYEQEKNPFAAFNKKVRASLRIFYIFLIIWIAKTATVQEFEYCRQNYTEYCTIVFRKSKAQKFIVFLCFGSTYFSFLYSLDSHCHTALLNKTPKCMLILKSFPYDTGASHSIER